MFYDALGEHLAGVVWRVFRQKPSQEGAAACDRKADREGEMVAEGSVIHGLFWFCSPLRTPEVVGAVKVGFDPWNYGSTTPFAMILP